MLADPMTIVVMVLQQRHVLDDDFDVSNGSAANNKIPSDMSRCG